ncbi:MAG: hypothetical protein E4G99_10650 [Anaerolineales bacterium]|nr:MAG: hypothetical protein E4G99_10650 [Anaerolineales bacterium]
MSVSANASPQTYWPSFEIETGDVDFIINLLLEREIPLTTEGMAHALVEVRLEKLKHAIELASKTEHPAYLPAETYVLDQMLTFPSLRNQIGKVVGIREGQNPDIGAFGVIEVQMDDGGPTREFASGVPDHPLNNPPERESKDEDMEPEVVMEHFGKLIEKKLETELSRAEEIVRIAGKWFPKALVAEINEGHLNLAEAVLDVSGGGPLPTDDLLKHIELPKTLASQLASFSLDYALQEDKRFDEVGPAGQVLWYLQRLEPPEVLFTPPRLESHPGDYDRSTFTEELLELELQLHDELVDIGGEPSQDAEVTFPLLFPHWRVGALPLSRQLAPLFPTSYEAPRIRFILVDGHSGEKFPGWVVRDQGYVYGLGDWYRKYQVPAGGLVRVRSGENPGEVIVETLDRRMRNDWIRTVSIDENGQVGFTMLKQPVGTAYDDLMVIGLIDRQALDEAWMKDQLKNRTLERTVTHVFRELAKLTPQSAVHAQTLYAAVNVIVRQPPASIFSELTTRPYFVHVGDLYWRFEVSAWNSA